MTSAEMTVHDYGWGGKPDLWARNEGTRTITGNLGWWMKWELPPLPHPDYVSPLPWEVAIVPGFQRLWVAGEVTVSLDPDFDHIIHELPLGPGGGSVFEPFVWKQLVPQATTVIPHMLDREGPVMVAVYSLNSQIQWDEFLTEPLDKDHVRISFDDPVTFQATVF